MRQVPVNFPTIADRKQSERWIRLIIFPLSIGAGFLTAVGTSWLS